MTSPLVELSDCLNAYLASPCFESLMPLLEKVNQLSHRILGMKVALEGEIRGLPQALKRCIEIVELKKLCKEMSLRFSSEEVEMPPLMNELGWEEFWELFETFALANASGGVDAKKLYHHFSRLQHPFQAHLVAGQECLSANWIEMLPFLAQLNDKEAFKRGLGFLIEVSGSLTPLLDFCERNTLSLAEKGALLEGLSLYFRYVHAHSTKKLSTNIPYARLLEYFSPLTRERKEALRCLIEAYPFYTPEAFMALIGSFSHMDEKTTQLLFEEYPLVRFGWGRISPVDFFEALGKHAFAQLTLLGKLQETLQLEEAKLPQLLEFIGSFNGEALDEKEFAFLSELPYQLVSPFLYLSAGLDFRESQEIALSLLAFIRGCAFENDEWLEEFELEMWFDCTSEERANISAFAPRVPEDLDEKSKIALLELPNLLRFFPQKRRTEVWVVMRVLLEASENWDDEILIRKVCEVSDLRAAALSHLSQSLYSDDLAVVKDALLRIFSGKDAFLLHSEHPLLQQALLASSAISIPGARNPFTLYQHLLELRETPSSWKPTPSKVTGRTVALSCAGFRQAFSIKAIKVGELPPGVTREVWAKLVSQLCLKMKEEEAVPALEALLPATTWTQIYIGSLQSSLFHNLLHFEVGTATLLQARFAAIVAYILDQSVDCEEKEFFSEREKALLRFGATVQNCATGKHVGIGLAYHLLEVSYRCVRPAKDEARILIDDIVERALALPFTSGSAFITTLVGSPVSELPHQVLFLKNILAPVLGLAHDVTYDLNAGVIHPALLTTSREALLELFETHFTPQLLVDWVKSKVTDAIKSGENVYGKIISLMPEGYEPAHWLLDEEGEFAGFSTEGALTLLIQLGFLQPH